MTLVSVLRDSSGKETPGRIPAGIIYRGPTPPVSKIISPYFEDWKSEIFFLSSYFNTKYIFLIVQHLKYNSTTLGSERVHNALTCISRIIKHCSNKAKQNHPSGI